MSTHPWHRREVRIAVFGGREFGPYQLVWQALDRLVLLADERGASGLVLVHGACPGGADHHADCYVQAMQPLGGVVKLRQERHPADWETHGRRAGPLRNAEMAASSLDGAVEFPGGRGTAHMRSCCIREGVTVWRPAAAWAVWV